MKILSIFGTRPEAIKMAPVHQALTALPGVESRICVTGQHREMLDQVLGLFGIVPDRDLAVMTPGQSLTTLTARLLDGLAGVLEDLRPDWVLVQGDTTTTFAGALAAYYHKIPVGHVEAGLRSGQIYSPFPEEINRALVTPIARLHFPPTERAAGNLRACGIPEDRMEVTGNTVIDALLWVHQRLKSLPCENWQALEPGRFQGKRLILVTGHRRESFGAGFENICQAIRAVADGFEDVHVLYPVHLNPQVQDPVRRLLGGHPRVTLAPPLPYTDFVQAMSASWMVLTDSGGVQEEAPSLGKPVVVMRDVTERTEAVATGHVILAGTSREGIQQAVERLLSDEGLYGRMSGGANPYGDGLAASRIARRLLGGG